MSNWLKTNLSRTSKERDRARFGRLMKLRRTVKQGEYVVDIPGTGPTDLKVEKKYVGEKLYTLLYAMVDGEWVDVLPTDIQIELLEEILDT